MNAPVFVLTFNLIYGFVNNPKISILNNIVTPRFKKNNLGYKEGKKKTGRLPSLHARPWI